MTISIILCTLNRDQQLKEFLSSLHEQNYKDFELIIVDQNIDERINNILQEFNFSNLIHIKSEPGLSISRNKGIVISSGNILAFPDDDCRYPPELLQNVVNTFKSTSADILTGKTIDIATGKIIAGKNIYNCFEMSPLHFAGSSTTLFIKLGKIAKEMISFDERFGLGSIFFAEEENDLIIRLLSSGYSGHYKPDKIHVCHPPNDENYNDLVRAKKRGFALGALTGKHLFSPYGIIFFARYLIFRSIAGLLLAIIQGKFNKFKFLCIKYLGIWKGFVHYSLGRQK